MTDRVAAMTGASAPLGRAVARRLVELGWSVRALTRRPEAPAGTTRVAGDLSDDQALTRLCAGAEAVFHLAGETRDPGRMEAVNVEGTRALAAAASEAGATFLLHLSSVAIHGDVRGVVDEEAFGPLRTEYQRTKATADRLVRELEHIPRVAILRPATLVSAASPGPVAALATRRDTGGGLLRALRSGERCHFAHVEDVAAAACFLLDHLEPGPPEAFLLSYDDSPEATVGEVLRRLGAPATSVVPATTLFWIRRLLGRAGVHPSVRFSMARLEALGFRLPLGFARAVETLGEGPR